MRTLRVAFAVAGLLTAAETASAAYVPRLFVNHVPNGVAVVFRQDVPESQGGAPLGTKLLEATFTIERVFSPPPTGVLHWIGRFVPYAAGSSVPNIAGRVESRAVIRTPGRISLRGRRVSRAGRPVAVLVGVVSEAGSGVGRTVVRIRGGGRSRTTTTSARGAFSLTVPLGKTSTFTASVTVPDRDVTATACPPCVSASAAGFQAASNPVRVRLPRVKRKR